MLPAAMSNACTCTACPKFDLCTPGGPNSQGETLAGQLCAKSMDCHTQSQQYHIACRGLIPSHNTGHMEYVSPEGLRQDGRRPRELRAFTCELHPLPHPDGSALFGLGNTKVQLSRKDHSYFRSTSSMQFRV